MSERMDKVYEIAEIYYKLRGRLFENMELLTEEEFKDLVKWFRESLKAERDELFFQQDIPHRQTMFENRVKHGALVPRNRFIFFKNRAKKLTLKELGALLNETFQAREEAYNALYGENEETDETDDPPAITAEQPVEPADTPETGQTETDTHGNNNPA